MGYVTYMPFSFLWIVFHALTIGLKAQKFLTKEQPSFIMYRKLSFVFLILKVKNISCFWILLVYL